MRLTATPEFGQLTIRKAESRLFDGGVYIRERSRPALFFAFHDT